MHPFVAARNAAIFVAVAGCLSIAATAVPAAEKGKNGNEAKKAGNEPELIGVFHDWEAFRKGEGKERWCYMASVPKKAEGDYDKRGHIQASVAHRPAENRIGVVSIIAGYPYKKQSEVTVSIDGNKSFKMFTKNDTAWAYDKKGDQQLVEAMKNGLKMVVKGTSSRGTVTTDTYSLSGFTAAYKEISKACGVK